MTDLHHRAHAVLDELLAALGSGARGTEPWGWVCWRRWARSPRHARRLAAREGLRVTLIGRDLFARRDDLDALAERNAIAISSRDDDGGAPEPIDEVAKARTRLGLPPRRAGGSR